MLTRRSFVANSVGVGAALAAPGARKAAAQADRRKIVDAQVHLWKAEVAGLEMGARSAAPVAGALHRRATRADDGRSRRGSRGDRAALLAGRPERLRDRGGEEVPQPLPDHGPHPAAGPQVGRSASEMEGAAGHAGRARDLQQRPDDTLAHRRHGKLVLAGGREDRASRDVSSCRAASRCSARSRSSTHSSR